MRGVTNFKIFRPVLDMIFVIITYDSENIYSSLNVKGWPGMLHQPGAVQDLWTIIMKL